MVMRRSTGMRSLPWNIGAGAVTSPGLLGNQGDHCGLQKQRGISIPQLLSTAHLLLPSEWRYRTYKTRTSNFKYMTLFKHTHTHIFICQGCLYFIGFFFNVGCFLFNSAFSSVLYWMFYVLKFYPILESKASWITCLDAGYHTHAGAYSDCNVSVAIASATIPK